MVLCSAISFWIGCGGSSDATSTTAGFAPSEPPPHGYSYNEANEICTHGTAAERAALGDYCDGIVAHPNRLVPVVGSDGEFIVCSDGKRLLVEGTAAPPSSFAGGGVPRCGPTGGGPEGEAIWVPTSVGRGITEAPARYVKQQTGG